MPDDSQNYVSGVREVTLHLPCDEGSLGFRLTKSVFDPFPWVRSVSPASPADAAGLKAGDSVLMVDRGPVLGMPVSRIASLIRGNGEDRSVTLLVWNCGVDPTEDPELLWSAGGGRPGEMSRRALSGVLKALSCCICASTATQPLSCGRSHLYCQGCWSRLERCALCRETLPPKESPYARDLVAEQVFDAIAKEYELKTPKRQTSPPPSSSPMGAPHPPTRKGQYQISMIKKRTVQNGVGSSSNADVSKTLIINPNLQEKNNKNETEDSFTKARIDNSENTNSSSNIQENESEQNKNENEDSSMEQGIECFLKNLKINSNVELNECLQNKNEIEDSRTELGIGFAINNINASSKVDLNESKQNKNESGDSSNKIGIHKVQEDCCRNVMCNRMTQIDPKFESRLHCVLKPVRCGENHENQNENSSSTFQEKPYILFTPPVFVLCDHTR